MSKYEITIKLDGENEETTASAVRNRQGKTAVQPIKNTMGTLLKGDVKSAIGLGILAGVGINTAKQVINYEVSRVGFRSGNYALQERINYGVETASKLGAIAGAAIINPIAGVAMAIGYGASELIKYSAKKEDAERARISVDIARERAGESMSYNRSRGLK